ncbi:MAG: UDP-N-acetylmuramate: L-alanyl-gamma-D-glutamyl-meso-diaminopimelate ligase [Arenicella sp.]|jgi:UDP-N-acetylmuramate: L-alanyl-gamma-D-glutamyl-meso-diaminopimelate ligase
MKIHIIGICGTFMGGVARLARDLGVTVTGSDANTYPPMSTQLESLGVDLFEGYSADNIPEDTDLILVGNTISRGNPELESVLDKGLPYTSGAQWLGDHVLQGRWVLAVAGTHGKTTTSSLLAWLLEQNDLAPGYLIGGVPENFGESARLGKTPFFVIEADEYDTAFCDKRSKFVHYQPRTLILNNLEFDHADIFTDLAAIQSQFNHLLKIVPQHGQIIYNQDSPALAEVLEMGYWSELKSFNSDDSHWRAEKVKDDASEFLLLHGSETYLVNWSLIGDHNMANAVAAIAAAHHVGIPIANSVESLATFKSVKRRMEVIFDQPSARLFDDFAHHPTAIAETLSGLRSSVGEQKIVAVLEPRSNTMKRGIHKHLLQDALAKADNVLIFADQNITWDISELESDSISAFSSTELLLEQLIGLIDGDSGHTNVVIMSNGGFENLYQRLIDRLS